VSSEPERDSAPGEFLPWDSEFFGFRIGRFHAHRLTSASLPPALAWAAGQQLRCAYFLADPGDAGTLARAHEGGFKFVDLRVDFAADLAGGADAAPDTRLRPATEADLPGLEALARVSHQDTRFFKDTHFPADRAAELYAAWIRRDFKVNRIFVAAGTETDLAGYVTCQVDAAAKLGRVGLIAVAESARNRGLGRALVAAAQRHFRAAGCTQAKVATQGSNLVAQRLYQAQGFRTAETCATFHRWF